MNKAIVKLKADKTSKTNQIFNRMLKILRKNNDRKINSHISSMHRRRIRFEIILKSKDHNVQKNKNK